MIMRVHKAGMGRIVETVSVGIVNEQIRLASNKSIVKCLEVREFLLQKNSRTASKNGVIISIKLNECKKSYLS